MWSLVFLWGVFALLPNCYAAEFPSNSSKRGLTYVASSDYPLDDRIWIRKASDLTWYYNYQMNPTPAYENDTSFNFVPMLWGAPASLTDTTFLENVTAQIVSGSNISYAMGFNEPDGTSETGGSDVNATVGAKIWIKQMEPLRKLGVILGAPAVTGGSSGFEWLSDFLDACDGGCTFDFIPIHWYGNFDGLASHIGEVMATYPNKSIWVTEFALNNATLNDTQQFFKEACQYFDQNQNITHYSYFGAFRSSVSNVGVNAAMLTSNGTLTDIGSWYLGENGTGAIPDEGSGTLPTTTTAKPSATYTMPALATKLGSGNMVSRPDTVVIISICALFMTLLL